MRSLRAVRTMVIVLGAAGIGLALTGCGYHGIAYGGHGYHGYGGHHGGWGSSCGPRFHSGGRGHR